MKITPIYIKSLEVTGLKTFLEHNTLYFCSNDGKISNWTLILGDNGIGKSTLLQAVAWMKPALPYDSEDRDKLIPAPLINDEENEVLEALVSKTKGACLKTEIKGHFVANQKLGAKFNEEHVQQCESSMLIELNEKRKLEVVLPKVTTSDDKVFYGDETVVFGYSASRYLGKQNLADPRLLDTITGFIGESTELYDAEEIMQKLDYARLSNRIPKEADKMERFITSVKAMLVDVLPDLEEVADIEILPPKLLLNDPEGGVIVHTKHGQQIPFKDLSLGYKTVISWTIDLAWRMFNKYQADSSEPLKAPAIVLIDEVDLHLHPIWQREIMQNLSKHFPNIQFVATAHSPLMVQAALQYNYAVVRIDQDTQLVEVLNQPERVDGWRADQILTSEIFGLGSARGVAYEKLLSDRQQLLLINKRTAKQEAELARIDKELKNLPDGENQKEMDEEKLIAELAAQVRAKYAAKK